ncbi:MAG: superoxide dismutase family protein [Candidatus Eisenbacteria bacterium]|nr:superoxide dismutase family protein [Candidatus Eisenbacteria bacterium]
MKQRSIRSSFPLATLLLAAAAVLVSFAAGGARAQDGGSIDRAVAVLMPTEGNAIQGVIFFTQEGDSVHLQGEVRGFAPGTTHGFHIHEYGDLRDPRGESAGGHYNPEGHPHAGPMAAMRHAGDFGNITAGGDGVAKIDWMLGGFSISGPKNAILGRGVVVHANPDDLKSQPSGNAGPRVAVGVIGVANPAVKG